MIHDEWILQYIQHPLRPVSRVIIHIGPYPAFVRRPDAVHRRQLIDAVIFLRPRKTPLPVPVPPVPQLFLLLCRELVSVLV